MKFKIFKMNFTGAVHFGEGVLITSADTLMADTAQPDIAVDMFDFIFEQNHIVCINVIDIPSQIIA